MSDGPKLTFLGRLLIFLFIAGCAYGAYALFAKKPIQLGQGNPTPHHSGNTPHDSAEPDNGERVELGIAYGTEKQRWLQWAAEEFQKTPSGKRAKVNLIPLGSLEGAQALLAGDKRIQVWSPASALYEDVFVQEWQLKNGKNPILKKEALALSPMAFVMWAERHAAFSQKYGEVSFATISQALQEPTGWEGIAKKPEWGIFKFGHTHPQQSNSGLMTLVLMASDFHKKSKGLVMKDILNADFQAWMSKIESGVTGMSNSTGNMMRDMVLRGPSSYDVVFVYENVAIDYLKNAEGRWGELRVAYPAQNMWNDNPYYVIDAPWSSAAQKQSAQEFLDYLLSEPVQRESLKYGFRPGNPAVPIRVPESPFTAYQKFGLRIDVPSISEAPKADVINNLLAIWQRTHGTR